MSLTVKKQICAGFGTVVAACAMVALVAAASLERINRRVGRIATRAIPTSRVASQLERYNRANFATTEQHLLTATPEKKKRLEAEMKERSDRMTELYKQLETMLDSDKTRAVFARVQEARTGYIDARKLVLGASNRQDHATAVQLLNDSLYPAYEKYIGCLVELIDRNEDEAAVAATEAAEKAARSRTLLLVSSALSLAAGLAVAVLIVRRISRTLNPLAATLDDGAIQVAAAAGQIADASQGLAAGASQQAASLQETSASLHEMSSLTRKTAESAERARGFAIETRASADSGTRNMEQLTAAMTRIQASSQNIEKILGTIDEIAFQTNILALNAAVEAARAGSAGAGFAVVADEVRRLAQHSAQAARETAEKIEASIEATGLGVKLSTDVARNLAEILERARSVEELIGTMASGSVQQSQGIDQINQAISEIDKVTQATAAAAEESASAAEELRAQAASLQASVGSLNHLVHGESGQDHRRGRNSHVHYSSHQARTPLAVLRSN